jgi:hypothetical protein
MKPFSKKSAFFLLPFFSLSAFAQPESVQTPETAPKKMLVDLQLFPGNPGFSATLIPLTGESNKLRLMIGNTEQRKCTITIRSATTDLWSTHFRSPYYSQIFDLSDLDDGAYTISIEMEGKFSKKPSSCPHCPLSRGR